MSGPGAEVQVTASSKSKKKNKKKKGAAAKGEGNGEVVTNNGNQSDEEQDVVPDKASEQLSVPSTVCPYFSCCRFALLCRRFANYLPARGIHVRER
jgi:hypothetical protein